MDTERKTNRLAAFARWTSAFLLLAGPSILHASINSTTGAVTYVANPPTDMSTGVWESDTEVRAFNEQQNLTLTSPISVDISVPGTSPNSTDSNLSPLTIPAGTVLSSYELHFDVNGAPPTGGAFELTGSITMSDPILGLIVQSSSLTATNSAMGIPGDIYPFGSQYGLELNPAGGGTSDVVSLSSDRKTVTIDWRDASSADNIRILMQTPEPSPGLLIAIMVGCISLLRRRAIS